MDITYRAGQRAFHRCPNGHGWTGSLDQTTCPTCGKGSDENGGEIVPMNLRPGV